MRALAWLAWRIAQACAWHVRLKLAQRSKKSTSASRALMPRALALSPGSSRPRARITLVKQRRWLAQAENKSIASLSSRKRKRNKRRKQSAKTAAQTAQTRRRKRSGKSKRAKEKRKQRSRSGCLVAGIKQTEIAVLAKPSLEITISGHQR
jgi:hypothetical protein